MMTSLCAPLAAVDADLLVLPWFEGDGPAAVAGVDEATGGDITRALASREFSGKLYELFLTSISKSGWKARRVALIGAGGANQWSGEIARKVAAAAGLMVRARRATRVGVALRGRGADEHAQPVAE